jgi:threonylcarbamoyladenosine tRNA methylthiotransferase MtaB
MTDRAPEIVTFGCRLNAYESEQIGRHARAAGLADAVIVNTCAVTAEAERQARQAIRKARRARPGARIVVTGCAAQIAPEKWAAMAEVDAVLGNAEKLEAESYARLAGRAGETADAFGHEKIRVNDIFAARETAAHLAGGFDGRARAFVQVQNGCDHRCTFCIIPYGRGNSRSVPPGPVVAETRALVEAGFAEIVLTGVDLTAYGADLPGKPTLGALARRLLDAVPGLARLRLSSLDPVEIDDDLWRLVAEEPRLCPHLHLSIQAGNDLILKRMKRRHTRADALAAARRARELRPGIALGADLIAGFPTESDAAFADTRALVDEAGLAYLHVFPYSARAGTPAARMPQLPVAVRRARAEALRQAGAAALARFLAGKAGTRATALVERDGRGRTEHYAPIRLSPGLAPGRLVETDVIGATATELIGAGAAGPAA